MAGASLTSASAAVALLWVRRPARRALRTYQTQRERQAGCWWTTADVSDGALLRRMRFEPERFCQCG